MIDITEIPLRKCRADLFGMAGGVASDSILVNLERLDDPLTKVRLASIFESTGNRWISLTVRDDSLLLRVAAGSRPQPKSAGLTEVESMRPGEFREHVKFCASWWESRLLAESDISGFFGNLPYLDSNEIRASVKQINSSRNSVFATSGERWVAKLLQALAVNAGSRVIWQPEVKHTLLPDGQMESQRVVLLNDRLSFLPTWAGLNDLSQRFSVLACGTLSSIALHAEAIIASGARVELDDRPEGEVIPAGNTLRRALNVRGESTNFRAVPALSAPAEATIDLLGRSRSRPDEPAVLVWAPPYSSSSGGIKILYRLAESLSEMNVLAGIMPVGPRRHYGRVPADFADGRFLLTERSRQIVHIQPETLNIEVTGAPRIRWELFFRGMLPFSGGSAVESETEPVRTVTHSRSYSTDDDRLYLSPIDFESFQPLDNTKREHVLLYFGKAELNPSFQIPNEYRKLEPVVIHRSWPSRAALAQMLQTAKLLISFDPFTALNAEATICGCPVLVDTRFADPGSAEALERYEFGLEGFHINENLSDVTTIERPRELWERMRNETARCEYEDLSHFVKVILPEVMNNYE